MINNGNRSITITYIIFYVFLVQGETGEPGPQGPSGPDGVGGRVGENGEKGEQVCDLPHNAKCNVKVKSVCPPPFKLRL